MRYRRIDRHFVLAIQARAHADGGAILVGLAAAEKVAPVAFGGKPIGIDPAQLFQTPLHLIAHGDAGEKRLRVRDLCVQPGARLGAVLVLEPAVGIGNRDAV